MAAQAVAFFDGIKLPEVPDNPLLSVENGIGVIHLDGASVTNDDRPADLTVSVSRADLVRLGKRELDPMRAVMTGRMKLSDMSLAFSLQPQIQALFERAV